MAFTKHLNEADSVWDIVLSGEIDIYNADELRENLGEMITEKEFSLLFECAELNYIDSTGLGVLASTAKRVKEYNGQVKIINLKPHIAKVFHLTGLNKIMDIEVTDE